MPAARRAAEDTGSDTVRRGPEWRQPSFGAKVRRLRIERALSQREFAGSGMSTAYLSRLERGQRRPTRQAVEYIADRLGIPALDLAEDGPHTAATGNLAGALLALGSAPAVDDEATVVAELVDAIDQDTHAPRELRWLGVWRIAKFHGDQGRYHEELEWLTRLGELSDQLDDVRLHARAGLQLARCRLVLGHNEEALASAQLAYQRVREHGLGPYDAAEALMVLVSVESEAGRTASAVEHISDLLEAVSSASPLLRTRALWNCAMAHAHASNDAAAKSLMREALDLLDSRDDVILWLRLRIAALSLYLRLDPLDEPAGDALLAQIEPALALVGTERHRQETRLLEARYAFRRGEVRRARELCEVLDADSSMLGFRDGAQLAILRGQLLISDGRKQEGIAALQELAELARARSNFKLAADIWETVARALA